MVIFNNFIFTGDYFVPFIPLVFLNIKCTWIVDANPEHLDGDRS